MTQPRVLLGLKDASDHHLEELAGSVVVKLYGHPLFPAPPIPAADFQSALTAYTDSIAATTQGGVQLTAAKNEARASVIAVLRQTALYVQTVMSANPSYGLAELLASGFDAVGTNRASHPLDTPNIAGIENHGEGGLTLRLHAVRNARQYEVQYKTDAAGAGWQSAGLFNSTRGLTVHGLTPGTMYALQVRATGGGTGASGWSNAVSARSL